MRYHVGLITKQGLIKGGDFETRPEADEFILNINEQEGIKRAELHDKENNTREKIEL